MQGISTASLLASVKPAQHSSLGLVAFGLAMVLHSFLSQATAVREQASAAKPLTTQFVKRAPRLTKPLELKKRPRPRRRTMQRKMVSVQAKLSRTKQSPAFQPVEDTPLEDHPSTPLIREHRLYQTDFLFRKYGFKLKELVFDEAGNLPTAHDPKLTWALYHPERFPIEVNRASREQLLRIPGIGPRSSWRIVKCRRDGKLRSLKDLKVLGSVAQRAAPFILLDGKRPPFQLGLWDQGAKGEVKWQIQRLDLKKAVSGEKYSLSLNGF